MRRVLTSRDLIDHTKETEVRKSSSLYEQEVKVKNYRFNQNKPSGA